MTDESVFGPNTQLHLKGLMSEQGQLSQGHVTRLLKETKTLLFDLRFIGAQGEQY